MFEKETAVKIVAPVRWPFKIHLRAFSGFSLNWLLLNVIFEEVAWPVWLEAQIRICYFIRKWVCALQASSGLG